MPSLNPTTSGILHELASIFTTTTTTSSPPTILHAPAHTTPTTFRNLLLYTALEYSSRLEDDPDYVPDQSVVGAFQLLRKCQGSDLYGRVRSDDRTVADLAAWEWVHENWGRIYWLRQEMEPPLPFAGPETGVTQTVTYASLTVAAAGQHC